MLLAVAVAGALAAHASPAAVDPCDAARAPLPEVQVRESARARLAAYRGAWKRACASREPALDVGPLFAEAEVLAEDVALAEPVESVARAARAAGGAWPLPALSYGPAGLHADWAALRAVALARGKVDDQRFWRAAAVAADGVGEPAWLGAAEAAPDGACVKLGEADWTAVATAAAQMAASRDANYARHGLALRARLLATLDQVAAGPVVFGCRTGDPLSGLPELGQPANTPLQAVHAAAAAALEALRAGRTTVRWSSPPAGTAGNAGN